MSMTQIRTDLGFADALDDFDPADWMPCRPAVMDRLPAEELHNAAAAAGFRSREPQSAAQEKTEAVPVRRRRTGRNAQFNLKARPDTIAAFCAVADRQGWGLGETLEQAVLLLEREYGMEGRG